MPNWDWKAEGFRSEPAEVVAGVGQTVFRVWGGAASKSGNPARAGVCFSLQRPGSRLWAERLFSVWEWRNACLWVTEFAVTPGVLMYVERVHPGANVHPDLQDDRGVQVFIENPLAGRVLEVATTTLTNDLGQAWISPKSGRA